MPAGHTEVYDLKICYLADVRSVHTRRWVEYFTLQGRGHEVGRAYFFNDQGTFIDGDK